MNNNIIEFNSNKRDTAIQILSRRYEFHGIKEVEKVFNTSLSISIQEYLYALYELNQTIIEPFSAECIEYKKMQVRDLKEQFGFANINELLVQCKKTDDMDIRDLRAIAMAFGRASKYIIFEQEVQSALNIFFEKLGKKHDIILDTACCLFSKVKEEVDFYVKRIIETRYENMGEILFVLSIMFDERSFALVINRNDEALAQMLKQSDKLSNYNIYRWLGDCYDRIQNRESLFGGFKNIFIVFNRMLSRELTPANCNFLSLLDFGKTEVYLTSYYVAGHKYSNPDNLNDYDENEAIYWQRIVILATAAALADADFHDYFVKIMQTPSENKAGMDNDELIKKALECKYEHTDIEASYKLIKKYTDDIITQYPLFRVDALENEAAISCFMPNEQVITYLNSISDNISNYIKVQKIIMAMKEKCDMKNIISILCNYPPKIQELIWHSDIITAKEMSLYACTDLNGIICNMLAKSDADFSYRVIANLMYDYDIKAFFEKFRTITDALSGEKDIKMLERGISIFQTKENWYYCICFVMELYLYANLSGFDEFCQKLAEKVTLVMEDDRFISLREFVAEKVRGNMYAGR